MYTFSKQTSVQKAFMDSYVIRQLRSFLDQNEPELVYWLVHTWNNQSRALTYKELREAILAGDISPDILDDWQNDYAAFVRDHLSPYWRKAMEEAATKIKAKHPDWYFDPYGTGVQEWTEHRSAAFVTEVTSTQIDGLRALVQRAAVLEDMSVGQLARAIRPMVGLTKPQAIANLKYYETLIANGTSEKKATDLAARYAARQHRYRGYNIARTELAFSYNQGSYIGTKQAQEAGYIGDVVKEWSAAEDERMCPICGRLDGTRVGMDEDFNFPTKLTDPNVRKMPPAHPGCRCTAKFVEVTPPIR